MVLRRGAIKRRLRWSCELEIEPCCNRVVGLWVGYVAQTFLSPSADRAADRLPTKMPMALRMTDFIGENGGLNFCENSKTIYRSVEVHDPAIGYTRAGGTVDQSLGNAPRF